ncbi:MAG: hypothetical protein ACLP8S_06550 [Solirubrobacteraceae bacterium]
MRLFNTSKHEQTAGLRSALTACVICLTVIGLSACGGAASTRRTTSTHSTPSALPNGGATSTAVATWADEAQQLCLAKHAALLALGYVHITYGGIERVGLPAVERLLDHYLVRLLGVLELYAQRQRRLNPPVSDVALLASARALDSESLSATRHLESAIAGASTAEQFAENFHAWIATLQSLGRRGDALALALHIPQCRPLQIGPSPEGQAG